MKKQLVTWQDVEHQVQEILRQMQRDSWMPDYVVGLTRGGLVPANMISQYLDIPMHTLKVSLRDSTDGPESNLWMAEDAFGYDSNPETTIKSNADLKKNILIVDDIRSARQNFIQFNMENLGFLESLAKLLYVEQDCEVYEVFY